MEKETNMSIPENKQKFSIIVPIYNELENVGKLHNQLLVMLSNANLTYEIIYVDDHSTDGTFEYLMPLREHGRIQVLQKQGRKGKAFSLAEGFAQANGDILAMIDGDLQYPPEAIPQMVALLQTKDIIVANRKAYHASFIRKLASRGFQNFFVHTLFGLDVDVQSGLKVFKRKVLQSIDFTPQSAWTFDLEFVYKAVQAGYRIGSYDINFIQRQNGHSKVNFVNQIFEIGFNALQVRMKKLTPLIIPSLKENTMVGAGIGHNRRQYFTHTTLSYHKTALNTFTRFQLLVIFSTLLTITTCVILLPLFTIRALITLVSLIYFFDVIFNLSIILRSLFSANEQQYTKHEIKNLSIKNLPVYSILCPLYKESVIIPQFLKAIRKLDWPKDKLDVIFLLEEDDTESIAFVQSINLPSYVQAIVVPYSQPKTKPKACNYGLNYAKGDYIVIYDAEDIPDPQQLKKAYLGFQKLPAEVACIQAKLNYYNPKQNLLTRFFTAEYSLWFDLILPGFQSINTSIPLGGTSNHFKAEILRELKGWDTFNVTEDADLGIRLFKEGYKTALIDSVTYEEANSSIKNWIRQRSRWIKGYMQSYLVHTRNFSQFVKTKGIHAWLFQFVIGSKLVFIFLNPILWIITILYFVFYAYFGPTIELLYITPAFYIAVISLILGNFLFFYYYMVGCAYRKQWDLISSILFIPMYWILISISGWLALYQLLFKPHYWEKTIHGLHLINKSIMPKIVIEVEGEKNKRTIKIPSFVYSLAEYLIAGKQRLASGSINIAQTFNTQISNILLKIRFYLSTTFLVELLPEKKKTADSEKLPRKPAILIFNWRDSRHVWAGGAEVYIHEIAKQWIKQGVNVTLFCGNDGRLPNQETVNGINIVRKGGTYTVYIWAFIYYMLFFRGKYSAIIDCENGIPFFTPLFVRKPIFLLIHHVHQEIFHQYLPLPFAWIARVLESRVMHYVYKNKQIITVSASSKKQIMNLGFTNEENIHIIYNGIDAKQFVLLKKTENPSFIYLGRLKPHKNIDICIKAFASVLRDYAQAQLHIVGEGESMRKLKKLVHILNLNESVIFHGKVSSELKAKLLAESWVMVQPSQIEGWGITVIESNISGTPVIASNVNGLRDSVMDGETGLLVEPGNVLELAKNMNQLITDKMLLKRLSSQAIVWTRNFGWDKSANLFMQLIKNTLPEKSSYLPLYGDIFLAELK